MVRTDRGSEFKGAFAAYLREIGIRQQTILPQHPRANGLVEHYNGLVLAGLRRM